MSVSYHKRLTEEQKIFIADKAVKIKIANPEKSLNVLCDRFGIANDTLRCYVKKYAKEEYRDIFSQAKRVRFYSR